MVGKKKRKRDSVCTLFSPPLLSYMSFLFPSCPIDSCAFLSSLLFSSAPAYFILFRIYHISYISYLVSQPDPTLLVSKTSIQRDGHTSDLSMILTASPFILLLFSFPSSPLFLSTHPFWYSPFFHLNVF